MSPRTVIGSFGIGADVQTWRKPAGSNVPAFVALESCWELISAASTAPLASASSASGCPPA
jgi:hypothetical protein